MSARLLDPRLYQIGALSGLLCYGVWKLGFEIGAAQIAVTLGVALATQWAGSRWRGLPAFEPKSALISGLSLCLLLRANSLWFAAAGALIAIGGKFIFRWRGKHLFNPTNFGLVCLLIFAGGKVWVSPGQWGSVAFFGFLMVCLGGLVVQRAKRADVALAFLGFYLALIFARSAWLGEPMAIPLHRVQSGALLLFAFFMISDPRTTPDSCVGRIIFALLVAFGAAYVQFRLFRTNGLLWSLAATSLLTPLIDWLMPGGRYRWRPDADSPSHHRRESSLPVFLPMKPSLLGALALSLALISEAHAFCGFYVAKADTKIFNKASKVVLVRREDKTVLTMANDFEGDAKDFAVVIPVPTFLEKDQIHVGNQATLDHLDAYSAPRLVEYYDEDPCRPQVLYSMAPATARAGGGAREERARSLGVKIEAEYTVGEYDIVILSAQESNSLETWLTENGYKIPAGASSVLGGYIKQKMRFFVAKVNLAEKAKLGFHFLRPIQVAYESPKFMLPIRLGMVNANGPQELFVFALTESGRIETTNYRTVKLPTGMDVPLYVKDAFPDFYRAMFDHQVKEHDMKAVFEEYAWDMGWCDPCAAEPLSAQELKSLGVFWLDAWPEAQTSVRGRGSRTIRPMPPTGGGAQNVFVTRLHLRYDAAHFPEDLVFQETGDRTNFQGRYVLRHPWTGEAKCDAAKKYLAGLPDRHKTEARALADLTGWEIADIYKQMKFDAAAPAPEGKKWYQKIWNN